MNPECRHYVKYSPPTPEEIADGVVKFSELFEEDDTVRLIHKDMRDRNEDDDTPGHTLYQ